MITNDPANGARNANVILLWIEDLIFESPIPDPPTIRTPPAPRPLETSVTINSIDPTASLVELYLQRDGGYPDFLLGAVTNPGTTTVTVATAIPLPFNMFIYARQRVSGIWSDKSVSVEVSPPGNSPVRLSMAIRETDRYDHALSCSANGTGFDATQPSMLEFLASTGNSPGAYGCPDNGRRITPQVGWQEITINPCTDGVGPFSGNGVIDINAAPNWTKGVWEGLYFRIDEFLPGTGPYTVYIDDMKVIDAQTHAEVCLIDDFESYTIGQHIVEGTVSGTPAMGTANTTAAATDVQVVAVGGPTTAGQIIVSPGPDGTLETAPASGEYVTSMRARFNSPGTAATSIGLASSPALTAISADTACSGWQSLKVQWAFTNVGNSRSHLRLTSDNLQQNAPVTAFRNPDSVIPLSLDGTKCDGIADLAYSFMMKIEPPPGPPVDCNVSGQPDDIDILLGTSPDCNHNGTPDECDLASGTSPDCNSNGVPDECDLRGDLDGDGDVDEDDFAMFVAAFGHRMGEPRFNPMCDFDADGSVTLVDYQSWLLAYRQYIGAPGAPPPVGTPGDFDADGDVDLADFGVLQGCIPTPAELALPCVVKFDYDGSRQVDLADFAEFAAMFVGP